MYTEVPSVFSWDKTNNIEIMEYFNRFRMVFVGEYICINVAHKLITKLLALEALDKNKEIKLYINSPGGSTYAVLAVVDLITSLRCPVSTIAMGTVASPSTLLIAAGSKGRRFSMPNSRILIHQPQGYHEGSIDEVKIQTDELAKITTIISAFYSKFTGLTIEAVENETIRDNFMSPIVAKDFGFIDEIVK
jgi:ATP-dependent Clp protease protease subunit